MKAMNLTSAVIAIELSGSVTKIERANPHTFFYIDFAERAGNAGDSRCERQDL